MQRAAWALCGHVTARRRKLAEERAQELRGPAVCGVDDVSGANGTLRRVDQIAVVRSGDGSAGRMGEELEAGVVIRSIW